MNKDKIMGSLLGAATGDALGYPFHRMTSEEIEFNWGIVTEMFKTSRGELGRGGDYTQLMLLTLDSYREHRDFNSEDIIERLIKWLPNARNKSTATYRSATKLKQGEAPENASLDFPTSGPACRNLPYAVFSTTENFPDVEGICFDSSSITHKPLSSTAASLTLSFIVNGFINETLDPEDLKDFIYRTGEYAGRYDSEIGNALSNLDNLLDLDVMEGLRYISTTADITEVFPASVFCFLKSPKDYERSLIAGVNAGYATDALCFFIGAISGAYNGLSSIPERWLEKTESVTKIKNLTNEILK